MYHDDFSAGAVWSPCNKFIALAKPGTIEILDAVTLDRLTTLELPHDEHVPRLTSFSPDGHFLVQFGDGMLRSWDLQTGGPIKAIPLVPVASTANPFSSTHSIDGGMVTTACRTPGENDTISTYDLLCRKHTHSYRVSEGRVLTPIWTHDECLRFATIKPRFITIWEAAFTVTHAPAAPEEVESLPVPDEIAGAEDFLFLPTLSRLAFSLQDAILVWDAKASKLLLKSGPIPTSDFTRAPGLPPFFSFSSDGRFFSCMTAFQQVYLWKESATGYTLHQKIALTFYARPLFSPSGESIVVSAHSMIHLWPTKDRILSFSGDPIRDSDGYSFILEFSLDETLAAFARMRGNVVTILDTQSGYPRLVIDAGMEVECLGVDRDTVVVVGDGRIVVWSIPTESCVPHARVGVNNSFLDNAFDRLPPSRNSQGVVRTSISPDLGFIAVAGYSMDSPSSPGLEIYDVFTGRCIVSTATTRWFEPWFTSDGQEVWNVDDFSLMEGWKIVENDESGDTELVRTDQTADSSEVLPWKSSCGHEVAEDRWVVSPIRKRLLWLPQKWRSDERSKTWNGRFLGLLHGQLRDIVILEFFE